LNQSKSYYTNLRLHAENKDIDFKVEVITQLGRAKKEIQDTVKQEVKMFFIEHWKDFGDDFFNHSLFDASWVLLLRFEGRLMAVSTVHKIRLHNKVFYNFKTEALAPSYHSFGVFERINQILFTFAYIDNIVHQKSLYFNLIFSTPNLRIIGNFAKNSSHIYPDPYKYDERKASMELPDEEVWKYVQAYNKVDYPPNLPLFKEACIVDNSMSEWPYICYDTSGFPYHKDKVVNDFGDHYLGYQEGKRRMVIMCAFISPWDVIRYIWKWMLRVIKNIFL